MLTKLFAALMTVIVCTGGIAIAATVPEKDSTAIQSTPEQTMLEATRAEDIALEAAGLTRDQVRFDRTELDRERGVQVWEVEFRCENTEYDFEIDAYTGEILKQRTEADDDDDRPAQDTQAPNPPAEEPPKESTDTEPAVIAATRAEEIALEALGLTREQVRFDRTELDYERGKKVWEVELDHGYVEYDFTIDAYTGEILFQKEDREDEPKPPADTPADTPADSPVQPSEELTETQALEIALKHAGLTQDQVTRLKIEKDRDDGVGIYEIEFKCDGYEYEYEVRASDGKILDYDKEYDD